MKRHGHNSLVRGISPTYHSWRGMIERCSNPKNKAFHHYGGRGISVCVRWRDFSNFLLDMGERPEGFTLGRKDNNGNYEPSNCQWQTVREQKLNTRHNRLVTVDGETKTVFEWAEQIGVGADRDFIYRRLYAGWSDERAIKQPRRTHAN